MDQNPHKFISLYRNGWINIFLGLILILLGFFLIFSEIFSLIGGTRSYNFLVVEVAPGKELDFAFAVFGTIGGFFVWFGNGRRKWTINAMYDYLAAPVPADAKENVSAEREHFILAYKRWLQTQWMLQLASSLILLAAAIGCGVGVYYLHNEGEELFWIPIIFLVIFVLRAWADWPGPRPHAQE